MPLCVAGEKGRLGHPDVTFVCSLLTLSASLPHPGQSPRGWKCRRAKSTGTRFTENGRYQSHVGPRVPQHQRATAGPGEAVRQGLQPGVAEGISWG